MHTAYVARPTASFRALAAQASLPLPTQVLTPDEAAFVDAAMSRFFPGGIDAPEGSRHLDRKLQRARHAQDDDTPMALRRVASDLYRVSIAEAQAYCLRVYDRRFQALCEREQDTVLALLEEGCSRMQILFEMLQDDSTEVFLMRALRPFQS